MDSVAGAGAGGSVATVPAGGVSAGGPDAGRPVDLGFQGRPDRPSITNRPAPSNVSAARPSTSAWIGSATMDARQPRASLAVGSPRR